MSRTAPARLTRVAAFSLIALLGVALLVLGTRGGDEDAAEPRPDSTATDSNAADEDPGLARRLEGDPMALGEPDAPVVVVEYSDFRCPFCARFTRETLPPLIEKYVDTGLVRFEFRDLPMFGDESWDASLAGRAAARQGKFFEFLTAVHGDAPEKGHPPMPKATLIAFAEEAGVADLDRFADDLDDPELREAVTADITQAQQVGVNAVPFFAVDNLAVSGAQPWEVFVDAIEQRLEAHGVTGRG